MLVLFLALITSAHALRWNGYDIPMTRGVTHDMKSELKNKLGTEGLWIIEGRPFMGELLDSNHSIFWGTQPRTRLHARLEPKYKYRADRVNAGCNRVIARRKGSYSDELRCVKDVAEMARDDNIYWMEVNEPHHSYFSLETTPVGERREVLFSNLTYTGEGEVVGVIDTGLDFLHRAFYSAVGTFPIQDYRVVQVPVATHKKVVALFHNGAANFIENSHGTAVSSCAVGYNDEMGNSGTAPASKLAFMDISLDGNLLRLSSSTIMGMLDKLQSVGAEVQVHSYGECPALGEYTLFASRFDEHLWNNPYVVHVVAAGNYNPAQCAQSILMGAPATATNVISVGASFSQPSYYSDLVAGDTSKYNAQNVASFSSRGPLADGRRGPTVYGPGVWETVARGLVGGSGEHQNTDLESGTSFAAPLVAGQIASIREWYRTTRGEKMLGATVKAYLLANTVPMQNVLDAATNLFTTTHQFGYGTAMVGDPESTKVVNGYALTDGSRVSWRLNNFTQGAIAWYDRAATPYTDRALMNDFNAFFISESGTRLGAHDTLNAEEIALQPSGEPVRLVVIADHVESSLNFSLAYRGEEMSDAETCLPGEIRSCGEGRLQACDAWGWGQCFRRQCQMGAGTDCSIETMRVSCQIPNGRGELDADSYCRAVECTTTNYVIVEDSGCGCIYSGTVYNEDGSTQNGVCNTQPAQQRVRTQNSGTKITSSIWVYIILGSLLL